MPLSFKDANGREWPCKITLSHVDDIRDATDLDLLTASDDNAALYKKIVGNLATLSNVMYLLAKCSGVDATEKDFKKGIDGDAIERMHVAFTEALADFSQPAKRAIILESEASRKILEAKAVEKVKTSIKALNLDAMAQSIGAKADQFLNAEVARVLSSLSTNLPDASGSTPSP